MRSVKSAHFDFLLGALVPMALSAPRAWVTPPPCATRMLRAQRDSHPYGVSPHLAVGSTSDPGLPLTSPAHLRNTSDSSSSSSRKALLRTAGTQFHAVAPLAATTLTQPPPDVGERQTTTQAPRPPSSVRRLPPPRRQGSVDSLMFRKIIDTQSTDTQPMDVGADPVWSEMRRDAEMEARKEPLLSSFMSTSVLNHKTLEQAVAFNLAGKLATPNVIGTEIMQLFLGCYEENPEYHRAIRLDFLAVKDRDPACRSYFDALLYFKGFQALQTHRVANWLWKKGRDTLAFFLQSQVNRLFQINIHPAATIGEGVFMDHGTGIVIGETAVVGNNVSILHMVTLGGSRNRHVNRHPKIGDGVMLGAGATILGHVHIGTDSLVGARSLVLEDIPPNSVAVGVPARVVGRTSGDAAQALADMDLSDPEFFI